MSRTDHRTPNVTGLRPRSKLVHGGIRRSSFDETCEALYQTSGFVYGSAEEAENAFANDGTRHVYSRFRNPTNAMFEDRLAEYEGAAWAYATASGMAAVHGALLSGLRSGDRVVAPRALFISCYWILKELCPRYGIEVEFIDGTDLSAWEAALSKPAKAVFLETPSNPGLEVVDLRAVCDLAHKAGAYVVVDNAFATPVLQRPFDFGADVIIYSATKHIDGQGRCLGGVILAKDIKYATEVIHPFLRNLGPTLAPFNSWLLLKGMETLELRVNAQTASALEVARFLEGHAKVERVLYPMLPSHPQHDLVRQQMSGGGNMLSIFLKGGKAEAFNTLNGLGMVMISNNLGDSKSLITHPATTTHSKLTDEEKVAAQIKPGLLRLSVGLEDAQDIIEDLDRALSQA
ncbi:O-succinylhomoserine sulfhydrylase [Azospirillum griseum]|uniref:O-succinylhomoserine sulfhydrylase n=1 Tax=Azospirillum griseum TaxID=2496639 RepID=A0A3S0HYG6_9PROT|nr:O-succinylhomoserine sulfhydrylase [Azospirillum griseum]RTR21489.1 O-succinylhomoserine sulfhydrylase [Azospirillum griseum]